MICFYIFVLITKDKNNQMTIGQPTDSVSTLHRSYINHVREWIISIKLQVITSKTEHNCTPFSSLQAVHVGLSLTSWRRSGLLERKKSTQLLPPRLGNEFGRLIPYVSRTQRLHYHRPSRPTAGNWPSNIYRFRYSTCEKARISNICHST